MELPLRLERDDEPFEVPELLSEKPKADKKNKLIAFICDSHL